MYKIHLNHELIPYNESKIMESPGNKDGNIINTAFKCEKCNYIIFNYNNIKDRYSNFYWMYYSGDDYESEYSNKEWKELILTCEEEQIKKLLE